jgi:hypothetical protein
MHNFKELKVWQNSRKFVKQVYVTTVDFPADRVNELLFVGGNSKDDLRTNKINKQ